KSTKWNDVTIKRILTNKTYTGSLVQNKSKTINYKVHKRMYLNQNEWIVVPCTHEPIIPKEIFDKANSTSAP
ncbi:MAG: recombinase family protein, partial [Clostridia bacterium]|nr:recombinase family protein [Clostridia bacterium]